MASDSIPLRTNGNGNGNGKLAKILDVSIKVVAILIIPLAIWSANIEKRVSIIENNRFTSRDAITLHNSIIDLERRLIAQLPPDWLKNDIKDIKARLRILESK